MSKIKIKYFAYFAVIIPIIIFLFFFISSPAIVFAFEREFISNYDLQQAEKQITEEKCASLNCDLDVQFCGIDNGVYKCLTKPELKPNDTITKIEDDLNANKPFINIKIPRLNFSDVTKVENEGMSYLYIPWLAQYLAALYKFGIAVTSIVAVVIIILQGARIIASGGGEQKMTGYKKIMGAVIGLGIAWGSFAILYIINPNLVSFKALKVQVVNTIEMEEVIEMQTTNEDTVTPEGEGEMASSYTPKFTNCPITLTNPLEEKPAGNAGNEARTKEFYEKIGSIITGGTNSEKILQVAEAASKCGVRLGSCGRTAGTIYTLAGIVTDGYTKDCLTAPRGCWTHEHAKTVFWKPKISLKNAQCEKICSDTGQKSPECRNARVEATKSIINAYRANADLVQKGWPDTVANLLRAGDTIWIYNANSPTCGGQHSAIFVQWVEGGKAQVIQGAQGKTTALGTICLKNECGDKMKPLTAIFRAE